MTPKSIDDAIKDLQELDKMYSGIIYNDHRKLWSNQVEEIYKYLIDRCELFVKQAFRANFNETGLTFSVEIDNCQNLRLTIYDFNHLTHLFCGERVALYRERYQYESAYGFMTCIYLIEAFQQLQEFQTQLNKYKNLKSSKKPCTD